MADGAKTKKKLLNAACAEFHRAGYSGARIREIAKNASANIASIKYHFGGKAQLYLAVLEMLNHKTRDLSLPPHPDDIAPIEARALLQSWLTRYIRDILSARKPLIQKLRILHFEATEHSEIFGHIYPTYIEPRLARLCALLTRCEPGLFPDEAKTRALPLLWQFVFYASMPDFVASYCGSLKNDDRVRKIVDSTMLALCGSEGDGRMR